MMHGLPLSFSARLPMSKRRPLQPRPDGTDFPKYSITTAAEMVGIHPQQLRRYEQAGMVVPQRTEGNTRRYSDDDIARLERIRALAETGANQSSIEQIMQLQDALAQMEHQDRKSTRLNS